MSDSAEEEIQNHPLVRAIEAGRNPTYQEACDYTRALGPLFEEPIIKYCALVQAGLLVSQDVEKLTAWSGLPREEVQFVFNNLKKYQVWDGSGAVRCEWDSENGHIALWLDGAVAAGWLERCHKTGNNLYRLGYTSLVSKWGDKLRADFWPIYGVVRALVEQHQMEPTDAAAIAFLVLTRRPWNKSSARLAVLLRKVRKIPLISSAVVASWTACYRLHVGKNAIIRYHFGQPYSPIVPGDATKIDSQPAEPEPQPIMGPPPAPKPKVVRPHRVRKPAPAPVPSEPAPPLVPIEQAAESLARSLDDVNWVTSVGHGTDNRIYLYVNDLKSFQCSNRVGLEYKGYAVVVHLLKGLNAGPAATSPDENTSRDGPRP